MPYSDAERHGRAEAADELRRMLYPERMPREGNEDHLYWDGFNPETESEAEWRTAPSEWSADTIEWVAAWLERQPTLAAQ